MCSQYADAVPSKTRPVSAKRKNPYWMGTSNPTAGQSSGPQHCHMRVVRPVPDGGEWWSHPTPPLGVSKNRRSTTVEKILSSTRYLAVTWHRQTGAQRGREERSKQTEAHTNTKTKHRYRCMCWHFKGVWRTCTCNFALIPRWRCSV